MDTSNRQELDRVALLTGKGQVVPVAKLKPKEWVRLINIAAGQMGPLKYVTGYIVIGDLCPDDQTKYEKPLNKETLVYYITELERKGSMSVMLFLDRNHREWLIRDESEGKIGNSRAINVSLFSSIELTKAFSDERHKKNIEDEDLLGVRILKSLHATVRSNLKKKEEHLESARKSLVSLNGIFDRISFRKSPYTKVRLPNM